MSTILRLDSFPDFAVGRGEVHSYVHAKLRALADKTAESYAVMVGAVNERKKGQPPRQHAVITKTATGWSVNRGDAGTLDVKDPHHRYSTYSAKDLDLLKNAAVGSFLGGFVFGGCTLAALFIKKRVLVFFGGATLAGVVALFYFTYKRETEGSRLMCALASLSQLAQRLGENAITIEADHKPAYAFADCFTLGSGKDYDLPVFRTILLPEAEA